MLLYIHIPFCVKKCDYCDFLSFKCNDEKLRYDYISALIRELDYYSQNTAKFKNITSIFIGGGTPSVLAEDEMERLLSNVYEIVSEEGNDFSKIEYTMECNPGTLTAGKLEIMKKYGVNRISIGLQSANDDELKSLGRIHDFKQFKESFEMARNAGFSNINVDIMSGLPNQTMEAYKHTLGEVLKLNPEHISAYSLIVEEGTPLYDRLEGNSQDMQSVTSLSDIFDSSNEVSKKEETKDLLPDEDTERQMYYLTGDLLKEHGFNHYEISNYAKPGFECKHNIGYWTRVDYAGIGLGAASLMNDRRYNELEDMEEYLNQYLNLEPGLYAANIEHLTKADAMGEFMFLGLRMMRGVKASDFKDAFNEDMFKVYEKAINSFIKEGLMECDKENGIVKLTKRGIDVSNMVFSKFI